MTYLIRIESAAQKSFDRLPSEQRERISEAISNLADVPRPPGVKKMRGYKNLWRIRVGQYRVVYQIHDDVLLVIVIRLGARNNVYRDLWL